MTITERRTMPDFAHQMRWLVDTAYPHASVVRVILDNLNTHRMASLYETFPAAEARRIVKRLEFRHTPKHASWLNPVLSLPKGWPRLSSARSAEPVSRAETPMPMPWNAPLRLMNPAQRRRYHQLALQHRPRQNQTPPLLSLPFQR